MNNIGYEVCLENSSLLAASLSHPDVARIELCDNLSVGGTTVSYGMARLAGQMVAPTHKKLHLLIRPRSGDFCYSPAEQEAMIQDINLYKTLAGIDGFVVGSLHADGSLNLIDTAALLNAIQPLATTFHMAFDSIPLALQFDAITQLAALGFNYILLHGSNTDNPVIDNLEHLKALVAHAKGKITLIVGKGVHHGNVQQLQHLLCGVEWHGTKIVAL
jgi:copper homeostasis protein